MTLFLDTNWIKLPQLVDVSPGSVCVEVPELLDEIISAPAVFDHDVRALVGGVSLRLDSLPDHLLHY